MVLDLKKKNTHTKLLTELLLLPQYPAIQTHYKVPEMITSSMLKEGLQTNTVQSFKGHKNMSICVWEDNLGPAMMSFLQPQNFLQHATQTIVLQKQQFPTVNIEG